jgi:hypothetical protein
MLYELVNVGRDNVRRTVDCDNDQQLVREVSKHLLSRDVAIVWDETETRGTVLVGGYRPVGEVWKNKAATREAEDANTKAEQIALEREWGHFRE